MANVFVPEGISVMMSGGLMLKPSQVYFAGIIPFGVNAGLSTVSEALSLNAVNNTAKRNKQGRYLIGRMVFMIGG